MENTKCIKATCPNYDADYAKNDLDAYYCPDCEIEKKAVARRIDKQIGKTEKKAVKSDYQLYNEMVKTTGTKFPRA